MESNFVEKLINPKTKKPLIYDDKLKALIDIDSNTSFPIINNVPILLVNSEDKVESVSEFHNQVESSFDYVDHYQKDAVECDYNLEITNKATIHENERLYQKILNWIPSSPSTILDVGCGKAWVAEHLIKRGNHQIISFDISNQNPIKALKNHPSKNHFGLVGDVYNIPVQPNSIDYIVASEIIEHVPNPKIFVEKLLSVLKKEGKLIITTPYDEDIISYLCIHCNKPTPKNAHIHSFNEANFIENLPKTGIEFTFDKFNNNYLLKGRSHIIMKYFPHSIWNLVDKLFNLSLGSPTRLLIQITKK